MKARSKAVSAKDGSLFTSVYWPKAKMPRRAEALANLERLLPWADLESVVRCVYLADRRGTGRPGYSASMLLRCFVVSRFWRLNDGQVEAVILDSIATAKFIGSDPWRPRPPSASSLRNFRQLLDAGGLLDKINSMIEAAIFSAGLNVHAGMVREPVFKRPKAKPTVFHV